MRLDGELLSIDGLEERAKALAGAVGREPAARARRLDVLPRLQSNFRRLSSVYHLLADDVHRNRAVAPAAEWLLDNFHLVEAEVRAVARDLPSRYYRTLPRFGSRA